MLLLRNKLTYDFSCPKSFTPIHQLYLTRVPEPLRRVTVTVGVGDGVATHAKPSD